MTTQATEDSGRVKVVHVPGHPGPPGPGGGGGGDPQVAQSGWAGLNFAMLPGRSIGGGLPWHWTRSPVDPVMGFTAPYRQWSSPVVLTTETNIQSVFGSEAGITFHTGDVPGLSEEEGFTLGYTGVNGAPSLTDATRRFYIIARTFWVRATDGATFKANTGNLYIDALHVQVPFRFQLLENVSDPAPARFAGTEITGPPAGWTELLVEPGTWTATYQVEMRW